MARQLLKAGAIPTSRAEWSAGVAVYKFNRFTYLGSEFEANENGLTNAPGVLVNGLPVANPGWRVTAVGASAAITATVEQLLNTVNKLLSGEEAVGMADNITLWAEQENLDLENMWSDIVRTTGADASIVTSAGGRIVSVVAKTNFYASALKATGFNLLHGATAVGSGYYFLVPALPFGQYGNAIKPNGVLFTDNNGGKLTPTVYFKPLSSGVPASATDGTACTYTDSNGYRFYTCSQPGYMIVSGITLAQTCAHVAWGRRYDDFVSPTAEADAGGSVTLSTIIHAIHAYDMMIAVGAVGDRIDFGDTMATWTRKCDRVKPTWVDVQNEDETYTHTATISGMKPDSIVDFGSIALTVDGTKVSYTDANATGADEYLYYELATYATGQVTIAPNYPLEDWGLEMLVGATGSAYITCRYAQGYLDNLSMLLAGGFDEKDLVIASLFNELNGRMKAIEEKIKSGFAALKVEKLTVQSQLTNEGDDDHYEGAGAPAIISSRKGRRYFDTTAKEWYTATGNKAASEWKKDTNAS
jgi:hypothetical protein